MVLRWLQQRYLGEEVYRIQNGTAEVQGRLCRLDPFVDDEGLLRVGGRLKHSTLDSNVKHPVIVPKKSHITDLLVRYHHERIAHQGRGITSNAIRAEGYWIIGMSSVVSSCIHKCVICRKLRGKVQYQKMGDLPKSRLEETAPLTTVP